MERTESSWGEPVEPAPRWRALLDRALLGRTGEDQAESRPDHRPGPARPAPAQPGGVYRSTNAAPPGYPPPTGYPPAQPAGSPVSGPPVGQGYPAPPAGYPAPPPGPYAGHPAPAHAAYPAPAPVHPGHPTSGPPAPAYPAPGPGPAAYPASGYAGGYAPAHPPCVEWRQSDTDEALQQATAVLRRPVPRPLVLAFANPKGGVHKTTATALAAATIGSVRGRGVIAWDDNELRGTLGLRAGSARHARTIRHLIRDLAEIEVCVGQELVERLDDYLRHASDGTYDVLAGEEDPRFAERLDRYTVRRVLDLLRRTHEVVCVDTGNNVESPNWRTVLQGADQLVVTTVPREDAAFTADWMLDLLDANGLGALVRDAVTLLSCSTPGPPPPLLEELRTHFATRTRAVVVVPYDPALETGSAIEPSALQPETRRAWLHACATILDPLTR